MPSQSKSANPGCSAQAEINAVLCIALVLSFLLLPIVGRLKQEAQTLRDAGKVNLVADRSAK